MTDQEREKEFQDICASYDHLDMAGKILHIASAAKDVNDRFLMMRLTNHAMDLWDKWPSSHHYQAVFSLLQQKIGEAQSKWGEFPGKTT